MKQTSKLELGERSYTLVRNQKGEIINIIPTYTIRAKCEKCDEAMVINP